MPKILPASECPNCHGEGDVKEVAEGKAYDLGHEFYDSQVVGAITESHVYFSNFNRGEGSEWSRLPIHEFRALIKREDKSRSIFK
jgi:hypothetical protein